ncbi:hypothetical protein U9M48_005213 [Paspalum notatum var. saurae]|uniref:Uncharacterized protein n=1 Tax=Paspalum notatum var. saurae TaxID=547442 RepID=A0AAQ3PLV2_PASNO
MVSDMTWYIQGHTFTSTARVLDLKCYDMILGEDWLEEVSPIWADYRSKQMKVTYKGTRISFWIFVPYSTVQRNLQQSQHHHRSADHVIPLVPGAQPFKVRPYKYTPAQKTEIELQVSQMLQNGIIRHSSSPFASPVLLVKKKDGTWRFCVDYRHLNAITVKHKHPMPIVDELLDELAGAAWFTKLDFRSGYHQICMAAGEEYKIAFCTHHGLFEFLVMPFGLTNAPATFQGLMNQIFASLLRKGVLVFMDNILIYSSSLEEHVQLLKQQSIAYLGHVISVQGVASDPSKVAAIQKWPEPTNIKELRGFLGLTGYYKKFIKHYGMISRPLNNLLKKGVQFIWTHEVHNAFLVLKQALVQAPVLRIPDFSKEFVLKTDACDSGIGAVLMQEGHPIAYLSKPLGPRNQSLSAVEKWRSYLQHQKFVIRTDHRSLLYLTDQRITTKLQHKAMVKLMDLNYTIQYKQGCSNAAADALSQCLVDSSVQALSECVPAWVQQLQLGYEDDPQAKQLLTELSVYPSNSQGFSLVDGILRFKGRVWVGNNALARQHILQALRSSGIGGHSGITATYQRVKHLFAWPNLKMSVHDFVQSCTVCQQAKTEHVKSSGLLQPLPIPKQAWEIVCLDFIEGLSQSDRYNTILVVIDKFTKYGHFIPLAHPFTALQVAQMFINSVYKLHGLPSAIVSDRDRVFANKIWQELFKLSDTKLLMSSSYHPQTDSQTERLNQCLECFLRCTVHSCPRKWSKWLAVAEYWYNTTIQSALGKSPFEVRWTLPADSKIHPVIHVSQLKQVVPPTLEVSNDLSTVATDPTITLLPEKILNKHLCTKGSSTVTQFLIQWSMLPPNMATWEEAEDIQRRFPTTSAWGQAST